MAGFRRSGRVSKRMDVLARIKAYKLDDADKIEMDGIVFYQVELEDPGKKEIALVFDQEGREQNNISYWD